MNNREKEAMPRTAHGALTGDTYPVGSDSQRAREELAERITSSRITVRIDRAPNAAYVYGRASGGRHFAFNVTLTRGAMELRSPYVVGEGHATLRHGPHLDAGLHPVLSIPRELHKVYVHDAVTRAIRSGNHVSVDVGVWLHWPAPQPVDVVACLLRDAGALDATTFDEWAAIVGLDPDSRKAETIYRTCLATGLWLRSALGDTCLAAWRQLAAET